MIVDDGLSLRGRGLAAQDTGAQARGGFNRIDELNDRIAAFIAGHTADSSADTATGH